MFDLTLFAHDTTVHQSTLHSEQGHHATSASSYLHFHGHALLSSPCVLQWTATIPLSAFVFFYLNTMGNFADANAMINWLSVMCLLNKKV